MVFQGSYFLILMMRTSGDGLNKLEKENWKTNLNLKKKRGKGVFKLVKN